MGRASQTATNFPRAIDHFQAYIKEYPGGADRLAARFHLGEAQRQAGQAVQARLTWTDLVRDIERLKPAANDKRCAEYPGQLTGRDSFDIRHPQPAQRYQHEPGRGRGPAFPGSISRASACGTRCLRDRCQLPGSRQERPGPGGLLPVPQGRWLQGRDRPGAAGPGRAGHDGNVSVRPDPPGTAEIPRGNRGVEGVPGQLSQRSPRAPMRSARFSTLSFWRRRST